MSLVAYSSSEEEDNGGIIQPSKKLKTGGSEEEKKNNNKKIIEDQKDQKKAKERPKAPPLPPEFVNFLSEPSRNEVNDQGKVRTIPHIEGNWATYVFISIPLSDGLLDTLKQIELASNSFYDEVRDKKKKPLIFSYLTDFHISLSRTVYIKVFQIEKLVDLLNSAFENIPSFHVRFSGLDTFVNDEKTRYFLSATAVAENNRLLYFTKLVDGVLEKFGLPAFYELPKFHASMAWSNVKIEDDLINHFVWHGDVSLLS